MNAIVYLKYPFALLAGFVVTYLATPAMRMLARRLGMLDIPGDRHIHAKPTPLAGGLAIFLGFHAASLLIFLMPWNAALDRLLTLRWWWTFLASSSVLLAIGLVDDKRGMRPWTKLCGQILVALISFACDVRVGTFLGPGFPWYLDMVVTVAWFVVIINAFNLIDGIDGLATGLGCIAAAGLAGALTLRGLPGDTLLLLGLLGACLAFLRYNFHPASIFLGDTGSMFLGLAFASITLKTGAKSTVLASIAVPLLAVGVPVFDTFLAIWRRTARSLLRAARDEPGGNGGVFTGDTDHLHHRLVRSGLSQRAAASRLYLVATILLLIGLLAMIFQSHAKGIYLAVFMAVVYIVVRHLAHAELWDSGELICRGLQRPPRKAVAVILYPPLDLAILAGAFALTLRLGCHVQSAAQIKQIWLDNVPVWIGMPFLFMFLGHAYARVWGQARISEYFLLAVSIVAGIAGAGALALLQEGTDLDIPLSIVLYAGLAAPLLAGIRAFPRAVQDAMAATRRRHHAGSQPRRRILVYGAGYRCTLFLRELSFRATEANRWPEVVALLDDDPNLHGRLVHGLRVLGGIDCLNEEFLHHEKISEIVIAASLHMDTMKKLLELDAKGVTPVLVWQTELKPAGNLTRGKTIPPIEEMGATL